MSSSDLKWWNAQHSAWWAFSLFEGRSCRWWQLGPLQLRCVLPLMHHQYKRASVYAQAPILKPCHCVAFAVHSALLNSCQGIDSLFLIGLHQFLFALLSVTRQRANVWLKPSAAHSLNVPPPPHKNHQGRFLCDCLRWKLVIRRVFGDYLINQEIDWLIEGRFG